MAEFCKVLKQAKRMCESYGVECGPCALHKRYGSCPLCAQTDDHIPAEWKLDKMLIVEHIVMDWAEEHPEPRYPTWREWHEANFPAAVLDVCPARFGPYPFGNCDRCCDYCVDLPIPADIAEKLGIKPIGGSDNG